MGQGKAKLGCTPSACTFQLCSLYNNNDFFIVSCDSIFAVDEKDNGIQSTKGNQKFDERGAVLTGALLTFAAKVNKVEPLFVHQESLDETCSDDNSDHGITYDERLKASEEKASEENSSTTALLDERFSDRSSSESEYEEGEILTVEAFIEKYVQDTIHAALDQWRKEHISQTELRDIEEEEDPA
ncbi:unnamed protein product [Mytilus coruscus]|uniref:Uncharacterized protein n=1 Tax=Mytilus coruscus TaxID=42192 RepID=A0A6J8CBR8_MYTCO|nr:unnamed protein product [Mytilus coruscus]